MDIRFKSIVLLILVVYFAVLGYMGLLHNMNVTSRSRLDDLGRSIDSQVYYIGKEAQLALEAIKSEFKSFGNGTSTPASTSSKAERRGKTQQN